MQAAANMVTYDMSRRTLTCAMCKIKRNRNGKDSPETSIAFGGSDRNRTHRRSKGLPIPTSKPQCLSSQVDSLAPLVFHYGLPRYEIHVAIRVSW